MIGKKSLITIISVVGVSTSISATLAVKAKDWFNTSSIDLINTSLNNAVVKDDLQPFEQFNESPILTQKTGPIISWGSTIKSLDWFGAVRWEINLLDEKYKNLFPEEKNTNLVEYRKRAFISWDLDVTNDYLWLLMNTSKNTTTKPNSAGIHASKVVKINSLNGNVIRVYDWSDSSNNPHKFNNLWHLYYQISALNDGNILLYSQVENGRRKSALLNTQTGVFKENSVPSNTVENIVYKDKPASSRRRSEVRNIFLVPIANNLNILAVLDFNNLPQRSGHGGSSATGDIFLLLVDDNLNIHQTTDPKWKDFIQIKNVFAPWTSLEADPVINRTIYRTFDKKVYFTIYNKFFVVDTKLNDKQGIDFAEYDLANSGNNVSSTQTATRPAKPTDKVNAISSYAIDANENVYYKLINDSTIYNLKIQSNSNDVKKTTFASTTYYDIAQHSNEIVKNNANSFVLFNVTGSTGALFALNAKVISNGEHLSQNPDNYQEKNYGLALAIVPSSSDPNVGDVKGLLNTEDKFVKPADFSIADQTLRQKLPSEITRSDLTLLNNGFFTTNNEIENQKLKYLPFEIKNIDDNKGTFTVVANLDQIPWFSNTLPEGFVPRRIEKNFENGAMINTKTTWIDQANISYDFKNSLPTKVTEQDLNSFDLFQANFASQTITQNSQVIYPKKIYTVGQKDDNAGTIEVKVEYKYVPLGVNYTNENDVLTYSSSKTYSIFKVNDHVKLTFAGQVGNNNTPIDINNTPILKSFLQSSVLPSSIQTLINSNQIKYTDFLNLADSAGYPTNKMNFSLMPDDLNGTVVFQASLQQGYYPESKGVLRTFRQVFSGFNKSNEYSFRFKQDVNSISINNKQATSFLPSSITQANILANFVEFSGFDAKDLNINLIPNDVNGELTIEVRLSNLYSNTIGTGNFGFSNYLARRSYKGFLTQQQFNEQFNIQFHNNNDQKIASLKQKTLLEIQNALVPNETNNNSALGLEINGVKYANLNDLVEKLLVEKLGNQIPTDWKNKQSNIESRMVFDNNAGTVAFFVTIKANTTPNINTDLNFVISYNDFARGNKTPTGDNLSFVSNSNFNQFKVGSNQEKISLDNLNAFLEDKNNINKLFSSVTGEYKTLIEQDKYLIAVITFPLFNSARIEIHFDSVTNNQSLKTYSNTFIFE